MPILENLDVGASIRFFAAEALGKLYGPVLGTVVADKAADETDHEGRRGSPGLGCGRSFGYGERRHRRGQDQPSYRAGSSKPSQSNSCTMR